jgi:hypothetical protein
MVVPLRLLVDLAHQQTYFLMGEEQHPDEEYLMALHKLTLGFPERAQELWVLML